MVVSFNWFYTQVYVLWTLAFCRLNGLQMYPTVYILGLQYFSLTTHMYCDYNSSHPHINAKVNISCVCMYSDTSCFCKSPFHFIGGQWWATGKHSSERCKHIALWKSLLLCLTVISRMSDAYFLHSECLRSRCPFDFPVHGRYTNKQCWGKKKNWWEGNITAERRSRKTFSRIEKTKYRG